MCCRNGPGPSRLKARRKVVLHELNDLFTMLAYRWKAGTTRGTSFALLDYGQGRKACAAVNGEQGASRWAPASPRGASGA